ncbi:hypothetical protein M8R61_21235 [Enterobacter hormaechei]|nr:hypothetical protein [Enterobacter hormaechei]
MKIKQDVYQDIEFDIGHYGEFCIKQPDSEGAIECDHIVLDKTGAEKLIQQLFRYVSGE